MRLRLLVAVVALVSPVSGVAHTLDAPAAVVADEDGFFSYSFRIIAGPGSFVLGAYQVTGDDNVCHPVGCPDPLDYPVDCGCDPDFCTVEEDDFHKGFVDGRLIDPTEEGSVFVEVFFCGGGGLNATTIVLPIGGTPENCVPTVPPHSAPPFEWHHDLRECDGPDDLVILFGGAEDCGSFADELPAPGHSWHIEVQQGTPFWPEMGFKVFGTTYLAPFEKGRRWHRRVPEPVEEGTYSYCWRAPEGMAIQISSSVAETSGEEPLEEDSPWFEIAGEPPPDMPVFELELLSPTPVEERTWGRLKSTFR